MPTAFFSFLVTLHLSELFSFIRTHEAQGNDPGSWAFLASLVSRSSTICFLGLMTILFFIRLEPIKKAKGIWPRVMAIAGTFCVGLITSFPRANLSMTQTVLASLICLLGTCLSIFALAHLGRSFSLMAEARRLVTTGPYSLVRHPLYIFETLASFGILLQFFSGYTLLIFVVYALLQFQRMRNEEAVLGQAFPEYEDYKSKTARLIPRVY